MMRKVAEQPNAAAAAAAAASCGSACRTAAASQHAAAATTRHAAPTSAMRSSSVATTTASRLLALQACGERERSQVRTAGRTPSNRARAAAAAACCRHPALCAHPAAPARRCAGSWACPGSAPAACRGSATTGSAPAARPPVQAGAGRGSRWRRRRSAYGVGRARLQFCGHMHIAMRASGPASGRSRAATVKPLPPRAHHSPPPPQLFLQHAG